jgi:hypothetical protein
MPAAGNSSSIQVGTLVHCSGAQHIKRAGVERSYQRANSWLCRVSHGHGGSGLVNESFDWQSPLELGSMLLEFVRFAPFGYHRGVLILDQRKCLCIHFVYFIVFPEEGAIPFRAHLAKISRRAETPLCRESAVVIRKREGSRVRGHPHLAGPIKGTERVGGCWSNVARRAHFRVGDVKRDLCGDTGNSEIISRTTGELKLINVRQICQ